MVGGNVPFHLKFALKVTHPPLKCADFDQYLPTFTTSRLAIFVLSGFDFGPIAHLLSSTIQFWRDSKIYNLVHPTYDVIISYSSYPEHLMQVMLRLFLTKMLVTMILHSWQQTQNRTTWKLGEMLQYMTSI